MLVYQTDAIDANVVLTTGCAVNDLPLVTVVEAFSLGHAV